MAQDIIGRAWIGVAIKDETAPGLRRLEAGIRQRGQQMRLPNTGSGGFGAGRRGGRESGAFGGWNQIAFGLEDAAVASQTNGWTGAVRAASNNMTMLALSVGGVKAQLLATAAVVAMQLFPAFNTWMNKASDIEETHKRINKLIEQGRETRTGNADRADTAAEIQGIDSPDAVRERMAELERRKARLQSVDGKALQQELVGIQSMQKEATKRQKEYEAAGLRGFGGDAPRLGDLLTGNATPAERLKELDTKMAAHKEKQLKHNEELAALEAERVALQKQAKTALGTPLRGVLGELDPLIGPQEAEQRAARERNKKLAKDFATAGVDGSGILADLAQIDRLRATKSTFTGLPDALSQFSAAGQRQAAENRLRQSDPAVKVQTEIRDATRGVRDKIQELILQLTGSD